MQVSIETLSGLERRMTIEVPAETVEAQVQARLREAAQNISLKGFRKGKVPMKVIQSRFGRGVRQEVLGEVMSQSYYEAVAQEKVRPAGQPRIEPRKLDAGQPLEFVATFEVYPEVSLGDFGVIEVEKKVAEITDADIDKMIETLRQQRMTFQEADKAAADGDQVNIDFKGSIDGEVFEGGEGKGVRLILGSKRMIEGFEAGLLGKKKGEQASLDLSFPENYHNADLAGKPVNFEVTVNSVSESVLPELNDEFFASFDITEGGEEAFRKEVASNMARELKNASRNNVKNQVIDGLMASHQVDLPKALLESEIQELRRQAIQQFGGNARIDESMLPGEMFREQAERRVAVGLIMAEIIKQRQVKTDPKTVRAMVEEIAESYEQPQEVINWYYSNKDQLANIESVAMEDAVIDLILSDAKVNEVKTSYEEALKPTVKAADNAEEAAAEDEDETPKKKPARKTKSKADAGDAPPAE